MTKSILSNLVEQAFSSNGAIVQCGGRYNKEQAEYAGYVVSALDGDKEAVAMLEAETGIGKTLAYLIASLTYLNTNSNPKKIIISTFTRMLQRQILNTDLLFALTILEKMGIENKVKCAYRMGKQSFFSIDRTVSVVAELSEKHPEHVAEYKRFLNYVGISCESGSGLWFDWLEDNTNFPPHITSNDVCLLQHQIVDNSAYTQHLEDSKDADLLITNHMTVLSQKWEEEFHAVFFDEAHELAGVLAQLFNHKLPLVQVISTLKSVHGKAVNKRHVTKLISDVSNWDAKLRSLDTHHNFWTDNTHKKLLVDQVSTISDISSAVTKCNSDFKKCFSGVDTSAEDAELLSKIEYIQETLKKWLTDDQGFQQRAIGFSDIYRNPSVASVNIYAGRLFAKRIGRMTNKVILISATLADAKKEVSFKSASFNLGFGNTDDIIQCKIAPVKYGNMQFVLCDPAITKPIVFDGEEVHFEPDWLENTVAMIESALSTGKSILVLTQSFDEAEVLSKLIANDKVAHHIKGKPLSPYVQKLVNGELQCLITPSAWEGVSIRKKDGSQLLHHVMITRIPFKPIDLLLEHFINEKNKESGKKGLLWLDQSYQAVYRLKQGMGRGNRHPNDDVFIHICDPRMPHYHDKRLGSRNLLSAIPERFLINYSKAVVFGQEFKKEVIFI